MLKQLNELVAHLNSVVARADKYRDKSGHITVGKDQYNQMAVVLDVPRVMRATEISIAEYVEMSDDYVAQVMSTLQFEADISEET